MKVKKDSKNVGVAVVGLGRGRSHVKCFSMAKDAELLAVCDINPDRLYPIAEKYDVDAYTSFDELLKREDIDMISICTPSGMHCDMAVQAAEAGKHVLVEKPLDVRLDKIDMAIKTFKEKGLKFACIFQNRFAPSNIKMKEAIDQGVIGKPILATAHIKWYRTQEYYEKNGGWRGTWALDGGGSLMNQSVHTIDLMQWMIGPVKSVIGVTDIFAHDIETEDMGMAIVKFQNGAYGTIVGSTAAYPGFGTALEINGIDGGIYMRNNGIVSWKVKGEDMEAEEARMIEEFGGKDKKALSGASDPNAIENNTTFIQIQDMIYAIKENRQPIVPGEEGRKAVELILAIYESAKTGKEVFLPL